MKRFPTIRLFGDKVAALDYVKLGRQELFRTTETAQQMGVPIFARTTDVSDTVRIRTHVANGQEFIFIYVEPPVPEVPEEAVLPEEEPEKEVCVSIYSGFSFSHQVFNDMLYEFNPTQACRKAYPDDFVSGDYGPVTRLAIEGNSALYNGSWFSSYYKGGLAGYRYDQPGSTIGQSNLVHPCQYSGPMARAAALAAGNGTFNLESQERVALLTDENNETTAHSGWVSTVSAAGFKVEYDYRSSKTHNIFRDSDGNCWLAQISKGGNSGVFARPLPVLPLCNDLEHPGEAAAVAEFGGVPSGEAFPSAFTQGEVYDTETEAPYLTLLDTTIGIWSDFVLETPFAESAGWVFDETGTTGRMCTYRQDNDGFMVVSYWEISFHIYNRRGVPYKAWAALERMEEQRVAVPGVFNYNEGKVDDLVSKALGIKLWDFADGDYITPYPLYPSPGYSNASVFSKVPTEMDVVVWVGRINNKWEEIRYRAYNIEEWSGNFQYFKRHVPSEFFRGQHRLYNPDQTKSVSPSDWLRRARYPYIRSHPKDDYELKYIDYVACEISHNERIAGPGIVAATSENFNYSDSDYRHFYKMTGCWSIAIQMHYKVDRIRREDFAVYAVMAPWNRNAFYVFDFTYTYGLDEFRGFQALYHGMYEQWTGYQHANLGTAFVNSWCGDSYPYKDTFWTGKASDLTQEAPFPHYLTPSLPLTDAAAMADTNYYRWNGPISTYWGYGVATSMFTLNFYINKIFYGQTYSPWFAVPSFTGDNHQAAYALAEHDFTACSGSTTCFCENTLYNRSFCWSQQTFLPYGTAEGWPPGTNPNYATRYNPLIELNEGGGNLFIEGVDVIHDPGYIDSVFNTVSEYPKPEGKSYHFYSSGGYAYKMHMRLVSNTKEEDFGEMEGGQWEDTWFDIGWPLKEMIFENAFPFWRGLWCQESVLGTPSIIYSQPYDCVYDENVSPYLNIPLEAEGTHPSLPSRIPAGNLQYATTDYNDIYRYLTHVGVNGP